MLNPEIHLQLPCSNPNTTRQNFSDQSDTGEAKALLAEKEATKAALLAELAELKMKK